MKIQKPINNPFLFTDNKITAEELLKIGYPLISSNDSSFTFLNTNLKTFSQEELYKKNIVFSNRMFMEGR